MSAFTALILALFAYLGPVDIAEVPAAEYEVLAAQYGFDGHTNAVTFGGQDGTCSIVIVKGRSAWPLTTFAHELLHCMDWSDDRAFNGSLDPTHGQEDTHDPAHSWVWWALRNPEAATNLIERMGR